MGDYLSIPKARLSFPTLDTPKAGDYPGAEPRYGCVLLIDKVTCPVATLDAVKKAIKLELDTHFAGRQVKIALKDGDKPNGQGNIPAGYAGCWVIEPKTKMRPGLYDENVASVAPMAVREKFYPGCYVAAQINFYPFTAKTNAGVAAGLGALQFIGHGEKLGGAGLDASKAFAPVAVPGSAAAGNGKSGGDSISDLLG